jgi:erythrin-vacuolar iron transport family protein
MQLRLRALIGREMELFCIYRFMSDSLPNIKELTKIAGDDKNFVLRIIQPGLAGLMDGSVSTLAPIFATAFATHNSRTVF